MNPACSAFAVLLSALFPACHTPPGTSSGWISSEPGGTPALWIPRQLCEHRYRIATLGLGEARYLSVQTAKETGATQELTLDSTRTVTGEQLWELAPDTEAGSYQIRNGKGPFNRLSVERVACCATEEDRQAAGQALDWMLIPFPSPSGAFDEVSFELVPSSSPRQRLGVDSETGRFLLADDAAVAVPQSELWRLEPVPNCLL